MIKLAFSHAATTSSLGLLASHPPRLIGGIVIMATSPPNSEQAVANEDTTRGSVSNSEIIRARSPGLSTQKSLTQFLTASSKRGRVYELDELWLE